MNRRGTAASMHILRLADRCCWLQRQAIGLLMVALVVLIALNVLTRALGMAIYWVDELAVYLAIWAALLGAAVALRNRQHIAVNLLTLRLGGRQRRRHLMLAIDTVVLLFSLGLIVLCWLWFDPLPLIALGGDMDVFVADNFNFIYREPTSTLGVRKFWAWLIMPIAAASMCLYSLANLLETLFANHPGESS